MNCFICEMGLPCNFFYCKECKKALLCIDCWRKWLKDKFTCPFDKSKVFIMEVNEDNKGLLLIEDENYEFEHMQVGKEVNKNVKMCNFSRMELNDLLKYYCPFYNHVFMKYEFSYFYYVLAFYGMQIITSEYQKWVMCVMLNQIMHSDWIINVEDVNYFGGLAFINMMNKRFTHQIKVCNDQRTWITFNDKLWCPIYNEGRCCETNVMDYLYHVHKFDYEDYDERLREGKEMHIVLFKHKHLAELFKKYYYIKFNNMEITTLGKIEKSVYFNMYFHKLINEIILLYIKC